MYKEHKKVPCKNCGRLIDVANIKRHENACINGYKKDKNSKYHIDHEDLYCKFCGKECKHKNSLVQHELRCKENPNRKAYNQFSKYIQENRKGKTKENCKEIAKQVNTMKEKYKNGYKSYGWDFTKENFSYVYESHNNEEINKWIKYIDTLTIYKENYDTVINDSGYKRIKKSVFINNENLNLVFEHNYVANLLLNGNLKSTNTVHHIDKNKQNNSIHNLLVFENQYDHKRFHTSKFAWLVYDENTHLFKCVNNKENN